MRKYIIFIRFNTLIFIFLQNNIILNTNIKFFHIFIKILSSYALFSSDFLIFLSIGIQYHTIHNIYGRFECDFQVDVLI